MAEPSLLSRHLKQYTATCAGFMLAGGLMCQSSDWKQQQDGRTLLLASVFSGVFWSGVRITGENMREAWAQQKPN